MRVQVQKWGNSLALRIPRTFAIESHIDQGSEVGLALFCPITSQVKGYPFEVALPANLLVRGVVLADQVKSLDSRRTERIDPLPAEVTREVLAKLMPLLQM